MDTYKGVRDFYPEDQRVQNHIFAAMREVAERYGYEEYNASILEPSELYTKKSNDEMIREETYTFTDRGDRSVTLRPEMTPTIARMVAARRRELPMPLRVYSIPNLFRYDRPQRGRVREHWQLNVDLFGATGVSADAEIILMAYRIFEKLGATPDMFVIKINHRGIFNSYAERFDIREEDRLAIIRHFDKKDKMPDEPWSATLRDVTERYGDDAYEAFYSLSKGMPDDMARELGLHDLARELEAAGIPSGVITLDPTLARGFDYYTGVIFEIFDTNPENAAALTGGGRYDNLVEQYGGEATPTVGFGMGDLRIQNFLETHRLLPELPPAAMLYLAPVSEANQQGAFALADKLRAEGVNVALGLKHDKVGDHVKAAVKHGIPYFAAYGDDEASSGMLTLKRLSDQTQEKLSLSDVAKKLKPGS